MGTSQVRKVFLLLWLSSPLKQSLQERKFFLLEVLAGFESIFFLIILVMNGCDCVSINKIGWLGFYLRFFLALKFKNFGSAASSIYFSLIYFSQ